MKYTIIIFAAIFITSCNNNPSTVQVKDRIDSVLAATPIHDSMHMDKKKMQNPMLESMMATMKKMDTLKISNDFDVDFANSMSIHHEAAIDMCMLQIATGKDETMIAMAKNMITTQKEEINQFKNFVKNSKVTNSKMDNSDSKNVLADDMKDMMHNMSTMKVMGSIDDDFAMLMISHHGTAIKMAKDELTFGKQKQMKAMAEKIIATQTTEVNKLVAWSTHLKD